MPELSRRAFSFFHLPPEIRAKADEKIDGMLRSLDMAHLTRQKMLRPRQFQKDVVAALVEAHDLGLRLGGDRRRLSSKPDSSSYDDAVYSARRISRDNRLDSVSVFGEPFKQKLRRSFERMIVRGYNAVMDARIREVLP